MPAAPIDLGPAEQFIRKGDLRAAAEILRLFDLKKLPRESVVAFANLARRAREPDLALMALRPYVRPSHNRPQKPKPQETLEYSIALIRLGALHEGLTLLEPVDGSAHPEKFLYTAFGKISQWEYSEAASLLERYLAADGVGDYQKVTAKVNLLSAYIFARRTADSRRLLQELLSITKEKDYALLRTNVLRMAIQFYHQENEWAEAASVVALCADTASDKRSLDYLLLEKWKLVIELEQKSSSAAMKPRLQDLRELARAVGSEESLRELDFYEGLYLGDLGLLQKVYFGTPYAFYREKIASSYAKRHGKKFEVPALYQQLLGVELAAPAAETLPYLEVATGRSSTSAEYLPSQQLLSGLLRLMSRDFYRPVTIYQIHDLLFKDEHFNPASTPGKIHQLAFRLNAWFESIDMPLRIDWAQNAYRHKALGPICLHISLQQDISVEAEEDLKKLKAAFNTQVFSTAEVASVLGLSRRGAANVLASVKDAGLLEIIGAGPKTRYRCK